MPSTRDRDAKQRLLIESALAKGESVVVDNTNPSAADRAPLIEIGRRHGARIVAYYFETNVRTSIMRNRERQGKERVPDVAIFVTQKKLVAPSVDEGFDEVHVISA
jgi:predicted kinase